MPAQKHRELFHPLVGAVLGYTFRYAPTPPAALGQLHGSGARGDGAL